MDLKNPSAARVVLTCRSKSQLYLDLLLTDSTLFRADSDFTLLEKYLERDHNLQQMCCIKLY